MAEEGREVDLDVESFVDYCRTQAGLLSGRLETLGAEIDDLLAELETRTAEVSDRLERHQRQLDTEDADVEGEVEATEELQAELEASQARLAAKQERMRDIEALAEGYADLAADLEDEDDPHEALQRVVHFEAKNDAPRYFEDRQTVFEAATES